jgi:acetylglutamate kinase
LQIRNFDTAGHHDLAGVFVLGQRQQKVVERNLGVRLLLRILGGARKRLAERCRHRYRCQLIGDARPHAVLPLSLPPVRQIPESRPQRPSIALWLGRIAVECVRNPLFVSQRSTSAIYKCREATICGNDARLQLFFWVTAPFTPGDGTATMDDKKKRAHAPQLAGSQAGTDEITAHVQARILAEALPHMIRYDEQTVVIKFGGNAMGDEELANAFAQDVVYLKQSGVNPIIVHGGGPQIAKMLAKLSIASEFVNGLRVTDKPTVEVVEMVLAGAINKEIVSAINRQGGKAVGISGKDANLMIATRITEMHDPTSNIMKAVDIGYVGDPKYVNPHIVDVISDSDLIPVIAPVAMSPDGETLNVNADSFASALAARMKAKRLLLLTDVAGVLDGDNSLISTLTVAEARGLIRDGTIAGGMIPKVEGCIEVVEAGVEAVVVIDGRVPHCVLLELFTEHGVGTLVGQENRIS